MEMPAKQAPTASNEIVKVIRKLRWVGLEEKGKSLELHAVTDTVVRRTNTNEVPGRSSSNLHGWRALSIHSRVFRSGMPINAQRLGDCV